MFHDKSAGIKTIPGIDGANVAVECFDPLVDTPATIMDRVLKHGWSMMATRKNTGKEINMISAIIGIGLGLILLWALSKKK